MYDVRGVLEREPARVKAAIVAVLAALVLTDVINISDEAIAAWALALELVLGLFYVRRKVAPTATQSEVIGETLMPPPHDGWTN